MSGDPVTHMAARGDGVTESGLYVSGALPGDVIVDDDIVQGPHHITPPCVHFGACGGCQLQHADDAALADFTSGRILAALASADIIPATVHPTHLSPPQSRRRASLRAHRTADRFALGFNEEGSRRVVDLTECHVLTPGLFAAVHSLKPLLADLVPAGRICGVTVTETKAGLDVLISNLGVDRATTKRFAQWAKDERAARVAIESERGVEIVVQRAEPMLIMDGVAVAMPPAAFLQATADGEAALVAAVRRLAADTGRIADLFAGLGTFALPLSRDARVEAADAAGPAIEALKAAARGAGRPVTTQHRDLFRRPMVPRELDKFDLVVLDPPRAGAKAQVEQIAASKVSRVAYVSCNPGTFARDAKMLTAAGFTLGELWPVGQFRWSTHVELAAGFSR
ncbi:MAG: class I SAM-dependent RNA methyltransferase [Pacificimonas sp.]